MMDINCDIDITKSKKICIFIYQQYWKDIMTICGDKIK